MFYQLHLFVMAWLALPGTMAMAQPNVQTINPEDNASNVLPSITVRVDFDEAIDPATLSLSGIRIKRGNQIIPSTLNSDLSNSAISITPDEVLDANTAYTVEVTTSLIGISGEPANAFSSTFTTGFIPVEEEVGFVFNKVLLENKTACTSLDVGPDGNLYVAFVDGTIKRYVLDPATGEADQIETLAELDRQIISLIFDPDATTDSLLSWVSYATCTGGTDNYTGTISSIRLPAIGETRSPEETVFITGLPHSELCQHQPNGLQFSPEGVLFQTVGGVTTFGKENWGQPETLLSAALIYMDVKNDPAFSPANLPVNVKTDVPINYDPYAQNAPVKIHSTGFRNMLGLVFHSNGNIYGATNQNSTNQLSLECEGVPAINAKPREMLFNIKPGMYYGHQNLSRGECVHNGGNPTAGKDPFEITAYPVGTPPHPNFDPELIYDIRAGGGNSANGMDEFRGPGVLNGRLLVAYFTGSKVIQTFEFDSEGKVIDERPLVNANNQPIRFTGALDVVYHPVTNRVYVADFGIQSTFQGGSVFLLNPITSSPPPPPPSGGVTFEAEDYNLQIGAGFRTTHNGYSGAGYMDYGSNGSYIEWRNVNPGEGEASLTFRYANGSSANRSCDLIVNGELAGVLAFPTVQASSWSTWGTVSAVVNLNQGTNRIRVQANSASGGPNLDKMDIALPEVPEVPVTGIALNPTSITLNTGEAIQLSANIAPEDATNTTISWVSGNENLATVDEMGVVTALGPVSGPSPFISIDQQDVLLDEGATFQLSVTGNDVTISPITGNTYISATTEDGGFSDQLALSVNSTTTVSTPLGPLSWSSNNPEIITVVDGLVSAVGCGTAIITVTSQEGGQTDEANISVNGCVIPVSGVSLTPGALTLNVGESAQVLAMVEPADASDPTLTWTSSNPGVAAVSATGVVKALGPGATTVTATSNFDVSLSASMVVTVSSLPTFSEFQAENYTAQNDTRFSTSRSGFTGTGYMDYGRNGSFIEWNNVPGPGDAQLAFHYANGSSVNRSCDLIINGQNLGDQAFSTVAAGDWDVWGILEVEVELSEGNNTIRVQANSSNGGPNLDKMEVVLTNLPIIPVNGVSLEPDTLTLDAPGASALFSALVSPSNATNTQVNWSSEDETIATVSNNGTVTGVIGLPVIEPVLTLDQSTISLPIGGSATLIASGYDIQATPSTATTNVTVITADGGFAATGLVVVNYEQFNQIPLGVVQWSSSDPSIATVDNGQVTAQNCGSAIISVSTENGHGASAAIQVSGCPIQVAGITVTPASGSIALGGSIQLNASISPADATNPAVIWTSADETIATVDPDGLVRAVGAGAVAITVTSESDPGVQDVSSIEVTATPPVTSYQAEDYTSKSGGNFRTQFTGYTGDGYIDYGGNGTYVEWDNVNDGPGTVLLTFRYANGSSVNRTCDLILNGDVVQTVLFPTVVLNQWNQWGTVTATIDLVEGNNTIRVRANSAKGGPNLDRMEVIQGGPNTRPIGQSAFATSLDHHEDNILLYPNPTERRRVKLEVAYPGKLTIYNTAGAFLHEQNLINGINEIELPSISASMLVLTIEGDGKLAQKILVVK